MASSSHQQRYDEIRKVLNDRALHLARDEGARERVQQQLVTARAEQKKLATDVEVLEITQALAIALEGQYRQAFEARVSDTCSDGLTLVFREGMELRIIASTKNGQSAVEFSLETGYGEADVMTAEGGSVAQVVSYLLRVLFTVSHMELRNTVFLDEAFNGLDEAAIPAVALLMRKLVDESQMQMVMSTHNKAFIDIADAVYEVQKPKDVARVASLKTKNDNHLYEDMA